MAKPLSTRILSFPSSCLSPVALRPLAVLVPRSSIHLPLRSPTSTSFPRRHFSRYAPSSNFALWPRKEPQKWHFAETPREWTVEEVQELLENPEEGLIIVDVREPNEQAETGRIPGAYSMPINSNPDAIFLPPETFYQRFGFVKPGERSGRDAASPAAVKGFEEARDEKKAEDVLGDDDGEAVVDEVLFYCKSGVRSKTASHMGALEIGWPNVQCGDMKGGWLEWAAKGGKVEEVEKVEKAEKAEK